MNDLPEDNEAYDVWDALNTGEEVEIAENPVPIYIREILDAQQTNRLRQEILSGKGRGTCQFMETDDGVLHRMPAQQGDDQ